MHKQHSCRSSSVKSSSLMHDSGKPARAFPPFLTPPPPPLVTLHHLQPWHLSHDSSPGFSLGYCLGPYLHAVGVKSTFHICQLLGCLNHTFLGLLAKIKCSICSLEFDNSNGGHCPPCYLTYFSGGLPYSGACTAGLAAWPWHCTTALAEHPLPIKQC